MAEVLKTPPPEAIVPQTPKPTVDPSKTEGARTVVAPFQITTFSTKDRWLKMLVYGKHGAGKTELLGSAVDVSQMRDVLFVNCESGDMTLEESTRIENPDLIYQVDAKTFEQVARVREFLQAYCQFRDRKDEAGMRRLIKMVWADFPDDKAVPYFRTVILDSISEVEAYSQYQILKIDVNTLIKNPDDMETSGWPEFRKNLERIKLLIRAYRDLPMNVLMAAADQYSQDQHKRYHYSPRMTGQLSDQIQGFFDIVGYIVTGAVPPEGGEAPRKVFIQPVAIEGAPKFDAKNRRSVYKPASFDNPSMNTIMKDIKLLKTSTPNPTP